MMSLQSHVVITTAILALGIVTISVSSFSFIHLSSHPKKNHDAVVPLSPLLTTSSPNTLPNNMMMMMLMDPKESINEYYTTIFSQHDDDTIDECTTSSSSMEPQKNIGYYIRKRSSGRRHAFQHILSSIVSVPVLSSLFLTSSAAVAAIDSSTDTIEKGQKKPKEFIDMGTQAPPPTGEDPFITLDNGVQVKEYRRGTSDSTVQSDSTMVQIQCNGKLLNLNGVSFYNTKNNNPDGFGPIPLTVNLGRGEMIPGLESGIVGMRKGGIRRIIIPAELAYSKYPDLEPKPMTITDQRALDSVVKNPRRDATVLFDVSVERFK